jgi:uroporphyrinogen decarboxylase
MSTKTTTSTPTRKDLFLAACRGEELPRVPVWMMRQAGRYLPEYREIRAKHNFLDVCTQPDLAAEVSLQPFRRLAVDAIIVFSDILIPALAMGLALEIGDAGPKLPEPVRSARDVAKLKLFDPERETKFVPQAIRRIVRAAGPDVPVLGFAAAPWTLACYMVEGRTKEGFATAKSFLYHEPKTFRELLHKIAQATIPYLKAQISAGAAAVQLFDTWCGELHIRDYEDFALPAVQQIITALADSAPVIYYTKASTHLMPAVARSGAKVLGVDWRADLRQLRNSLGPKIALQGNVDPAVLLGPAEEIRTVTHETLATLAGVGHILNLGHGILPNTPVENAQLFVQMGQQPFEVAPSPSEAKVAKSRAEAILAEDWTDADVAKVHHPSGQRHSRADAILAEDWTEADVAKVRHPSGQRHSRADAILAADWTEADVAKVRHPRSDKKHDNAAAESRPLETPATEKAQGAAASAHAGPRKAPNPPRKKKPL